MTRLVLQGLLVAALLAAAGCGAKPLAPGAGTALAPTMVDGKPAHRFGFGAEGGAQPALLARTAGGFALAYVGTRSGARRVHLVTSADGRAWSPAVALPAAEFSDASPGLVEDADGGLHLYFVSNRSGEGQQVFHSAWRAGGFGDPEVVPGLDGAQELAVTQVGAEVVLVAEVMGAGVLARQGRPGAALTELAPVAAAGAEPAVCALPGGRVAVAFQRDGKVWLRLGKPGAWGDEVVAASSSSRLRDPALCWAGGKGALAWAERGADGVAIRLRSFDEAAAFGAVESPGVGPGEARGAAFAASEDGVRLLAWGMKTPAGQQGVMVTTR